MIQFVKSILKPIYFFIFSKKHRTFYFLFTIWGRKSRYSYIDKINFLNFNISIPDFKSFIWQYKEIFIDEIYFFESNTKKPVILDCGSNIGTSILYFKTIFPNSIIHAFEPDINIFNILKNNLKKNNLTNIFLNNSAVWIHDNGVNFSCEGSDAGAIDNSKSVNTTVQSISLKSKLQTFSKIDFLKMDIEGSEYEVILDCTDELKKIKYIYLEFHSFRNSKQKLSQILQILENNHFRYSIESVNKITKPFLYKNITDIMDLQLHIFSINSKFDSND